MHVLNVEQYCIHISMYFSAKNNLARSIHMLDKGNPAGAQSVDKCTNMALQLPLYHTVRNMASMVHLAINTRCMWTNHYEGLHFIAFDF